MNDPVTLNRYRRLNNDIVQLEKKRHVAKVEIAALKLVALLIVLLEFVPRKEEWKEEWKVFDER